MTCVVFSDILPTGLDKRYLHEFDVKLTGLPVILLLGRAQQCLGAQGATV